MFPFGMLWWLIHEEEKRGRVEPTIGTLVDFIDDFISEPWYKKILWVFLMFVTPVMFIWSIAWLATGCFWALIYMGWCFS